MQLDAQHRNTASAATTRTAATPPAPAKSAPTPTTAPAKSPQDQRAPATQAGRATAALSLSNPNPQSGVMLLGLNQATNWSSMALPQPMVRARSKKWMARTWRFRQKLIFLGS